VQPRMAMHTKGDLPRRFLAARPPMVHQQALVR
jgi:hypothetical protein